MTEPAAKYRRRTAGGRDGLGHIDHLIIENFKSYAGRHQIGPFDKFTCIIGPNGSGKSNLMDAISFCLGIRSRQLRSEKLKDLIYRREEEDSAKVKSARVTIVFCTAAGGLLHFERHVYSSGSSIYFFGPPDHLQSVKYEEFSRHLADQSICVKARNFLVFQGDVMEVARQQGHELTALLETISGSEELKERYSKTSRELETVQEKARMHFQHRREIESSLTTLQKQSAEVRHYHDLRSRRDNLAVEVILFKLGCIEQEVERVKAEGQALLNDLQQGQSDLEVQKKAINEKSAQNDIMTREAGKIEEQNGVLFADLQRLRHSCRTSKNQLSHWQDRLASKKLQLELEEKKQKMLEESLHQLREDRAQADEQLKELRRRKPRPTRLTAEQRTAYDEAVARTDSSNAKTRESLREAEEEVMALEKEMVLHRRELQEASADQDRAAEKKEDLCRERQALELELVSDASHLKERQAEAEAAAEETKKCLRALDALVEEQHILRTKVDAAWAVRERLEVIEARNAVANDLRGAFPADVLGRVSEILLPTQRRFDLPVQTALANLAEAFVVRSSEAARRCVSFLKERKIPTEVFLPLDRMKVPNLGSPYHRLVHRQKARHLATHCVQPNQKFLERQSSWQAEDTAVADVINFLFSDTIIVDSLEEAKRTAYDKNGGGCQRPPLVVTLHGEVIARSGNMSVTSTNAGHVEFGVDLQEIRADQDRLAAVEAALIQRREESANRRSYERDLREKIQDISARLKARTARVQVLDDLKEQEENLVAARDTRTQNIKAKIEEGERKLVAGRRRQQNFEAELMMLGKQHFEKLNQELGVEDVREVLRREQREQQMLTQEIEAKEDAIRSLSGEERSKEQRLQACQDKWLARDVAQLEKDISAASEGDQSNSSKEDALQQRLDEGRGQLKEISQKIDEASQQLKQKMEEHQQQQEHVEELNKAMTRHNSKHRTLLNTRCAIFRDCNERAIKVPLLEQGDAAMDLLLSRERDLDDLPFAELQEACEKVCADYSLLPQAKKDLAAHTALSDSRAVEIEYEQEVYKINRELEGLHPNMHAPEECAAEEDKLQKVRKLQQEASAENQRLGREFEAIRSERISRFMECYRHVETKVNTFYKELTSYDGFDGGFAYLELEDSEEPYNGGITFTAQPPGKRFFPMELLSGGEKAMASMALLFAMHSYMPPPFMILDEVDAPFDRKNTGSLVEYLKKLDFQCLVISLKDAVYCHSDSLVGIYKDFDVQSSGSIYNNLNQVAISMETPDDKVPLADVTGDLN